MNEFLIAILGGFAGAFFSEIIKTTRAYYSKKRSQSQEINVARYEDIVSWGWNSRKLLNLLIPLDNELMKNLPEEHEGTVDQWAPVFEQHPDSWALLTKGRKSVVGYWSFSVLNEKTFRRAFDGELLDSEITVEKLLDFDRPGIYSMYFVFLGIHPSHSWRATRLTNAFFATLTDLAERGIFFREICANAVTTEGAAYCEKFGMTKHRPHANKGMIYLLPLNPWPDSLKTNRLQKLRLLYELGLSKEHLPQT